MDAPSARSVQPDVAQDERAVLVHLSQSHRMPRRLTPLGWASGVEDLERAGIALVLSLVQRQVGVAEEHRVGLREASALTAQASVLRARIVDDGDRPSSEVEGRALRQLLGELRDVDI